MMQVLFFDEILSAWLFRAMVSTILLEQRRSSMLEVNTYIDCSHSYSSLSEVLSVSNTIEKNSCTVLSYLFDDIIDENVGKRSTEEVDDESLLIDILVYIRIDD